MIKRTTSVAEALDGQRGRTTSRFMSVAAANMMAKRAASTNEVFTYKGLGLMGSDKTNEMTTSDNKAPAFNKARNMSTNDVA